MKKLISLRKHLSDGVQELKDNPDKLVAFIEKGETHNTPRENSLSFEYRYTATGALPIYPLSLHDALPNRKSVV